jgi:hypothetical protein
MKADRIDVLLGGSGREQLFLLAFADLVGAVDTDLRKIRLFQYPAQKSWYSLGMLNLDALAEGPEPTLLTADTLDALRRIWRVICQPTPHGLFALHADDPGVEDFPNLHRGIAALVSSYPDSTTGLTLVEERLLKCMPGTWTASARVVGNAMIGDGEGPSIGDVILFHRLTSMADPGLPSPAVELRGDSYEMRSSEVRITDFGRACLKGEANHAQTNGIDAWTGGVHLTAGNLWFRDPKGRLVAPV